MMSIVPPPVTRIWVPRIQRRSSATPYLESGLVHALPLSCPNRSCSRRPINEPIQCCLERALGLWDLLAYDVDHVSVYLIFGLVASSLRRGIQICICEYALAGFRASSLPRFVRSETLFSMPLVLDEDRPTDIASFYLDILNRFGYLEVGCRLTMRPADGGGLAGIPCPFTVVLPSDEMVLMNRCPRPLDAWIR
ncbi:hypothetical protein Nepgr_030890 [Nepenthes gracilis]|uniref:Uncharacterized protein n=1 Tax=Nepenthes gracilis TaxID=150966 RepID=A0AAD3TGM0_NEPGR|nr:hypothetical protein Nepgr_030890 [Nepenthes gracilis]